MKKREIVNIAGDFEAQALRVLRETPGITVSPEPRDSNRGADAVLRFAGERSPILVQFKRHANAATAWQLVQYASGVTGTPILLIAGETTEEARAILEDHGVAVIDGLGNAHIELPGLMFHLEGRRRPRGPAAPTRLRGKAGVAAQALLLNPDRRWAVKELAKEADVSLGLAHRVFDRLEREGIVGVEGAGPQRVRRVINPTALLDLWAEEQDDHPARTTGYLLAQTPQQLITKLSGNLERSGVDHAVTGAAAASFVAPFVTAVPVADVWVPAAAAATDLYVASEAERVSDGQNVVFLQMKDDTPLMFRQRVHDLWLANPFRLYVDLRRDPRRGQEQADHLREQVIMF